MSLIGTQLQPFQAEAFKNNEFITVTDKDLLGKWSVVFFYPADFTFVCPTELHAFQQKLQEFERRNVAVVGCSVDSQFSHFAWLNQDKNKGGIHGVTYPLVSDFSKTISENFGVLAADYITNESGELISRGNPVA